MKKMTFIDSLADKSFYLFLLNGTPIICRLIGLFLFTHYPAHKFLIWFFMPYPNLNIFWAFIIMNAGFISLAYMEYLGKKLNESIE